jgi:hypothetical protein
LAESGASDSDCREGDRFAGGAAEEPRDDGPCCGGEGGSCQAIEDVVISGADDSERHQSGIEHADAVQQAIAG